VSISLKDNTELIKKVLKDTYTPVVIKSIIIYDVIDSGSCLVSMTLNDSQSIECSGTGIVDAIFSGLKKSFSKDFRSLEKLSIKKFEAKAVSAGLDSEVIIYVQVKNSYGSTITFTDQSNSLITSSTKICAQIAEFFINSHKAYVTLSAALQEASNRNRQDLVERYTKELALIVVCTGYHE
jgi:hypothetical protein